MIKRRPVGTRTSVSLEPRIQPHKDCPIAPLSTVIISWAGNTAAACSKKGEVFSSSLCIPSSGGTLMGPSQITCTLLGPVTIVREMGDYN